jgi:hypothetical protein
VTLLLGRSAPGAGVYRGGATSDQSRPPHVDPHMHCALTDLHAYVLALDAERDRLGDPEHLLTNVVCSENAALALLRAELAEESGAVRRMLSTLRAEADPEGNLL